MRWLPRSSGEVLNHGDAHSASSLVTRVALFAVCDVVRNLYRVALNDDAGSELYVSSVTGEVVLDTTRRERVWNYVGSVTHWIYPTILRKNHGAWDATVWWLSLVALIAAISGSILGILRVKI